MIFQKVLCISVTVACLYQLPSDNVKNSDCGKQIACNGLAAFWAFQGWGNNPDLYGQEFTEKVAGYLQREGKANDTEGRTFEDHIWYFHGWSFSVPTNPLSMF